MPIDMATDRYPKHFEVIKDGENWTFKNHIFGESDSFVYGGCQHASK
ncbi:hypothetical protein ACQKKK_11800 [Peribacillus sp. NPDC006672]